ncbi:MFS transporter [Serinibacter arcticus]|nr:MFS transporter [Serinibacter arcticus]
MSRIDSMRADEPDSRQLARVAFRATFGVFVLSGFLFASWVSRIPTVRTDLDVGPATIGTILLVGSLGSVVALPLAGAVVMRLGTARTVVAATCVAGAGFAALAGSVALGNLVLMAASLAFASVGIAGWDVAMNLEGAMVERGLGRAVMPMFHAGFSLGTVAGAGVGALAAHLGVSPSWHVVAAVVAVVALVTVAVRRFLAETGGTPDVSAATDPSAAAVPAPPRRHPFAAWAEPRTLLIGLLVLSAALTEGAANDWLGLAGIEAFDLTDSGGALMLAAFLAAMTAMRFLGTGLLDRFGRVVVLRLCIALALTGLTLFSLAPTVPLGVVGVVLWGLGAALGFPVGMSAASDDPLHAAARVSVVSSIGYTAFLAGPPLLGLLAEHVGYRNALLVILLPLAVSLLVTRVAAPPADARPAGVQDAT